jgi:RimJ/RimL family protein N-acetyltransferase
MMQNIETARLHLRPLSTADAAFILNLLNQPSFLRFIGDRGVRDIPAAEQYLLNGPLRSYTQHGFGLLMVELREGHTPIGICGLIKRAELEDVDVGYALLPQFWSKGYASEAAAAVLAYGKATLNLQRIVAIVAPDNLASIRVLEHNGLRFERPLKWPPEDTELSLYAWQTP